MATRPVDPLIVVAAAVRPLPLEESEPGGKSRIDPFRSPQLCPCYWKQVISASVTFYACLSVCLMRPFDWRSCSPFVPMPSLTCTVWWQEHRLERRRPVLIGRATTAAVARGNAFGSWTPRSWCSRSTIQSRTRRTDDVTARWSLSPWKRSEMGIGIVNRRRCAFIRWSIQRAL